MKRTRWLVCALGLALGAAVLTLGWEADAAKPPKADKPRKIKPGQLAKVYAAWFASPYEYMFAEAKPSPDGSGPGLRMLEAGIGGIIDYGSLSEALAKVFKLKYTGYGDRSPIDRLAGRPAIKRKGKSFHHDFSHYDSKVIRWGVANLIPDPKSEIMGIKAQVLYDMVGQRFFRMMTEAYLYLKGRGTFAAEQKAYLSAMKAKRFDGIDYLEERFADALPGYQPSGATDSPMTAPMAIGFWLRRGVDGTAKELWKGLARLMTLYDGNWWKEIRRHDYER